MFFLSYFKHLPAKLYFAAVPILGCKYPFSLCWGKRTFHHRKDIFQTKHRSHRISSIASFPFVYLIHLLHRLSLAFLFSIIHFYFILLRNFYWWAWISLTKIVEITFSQYSLAYKKKWNDYWCYFFLPAYAGSVRHSEANAFCSATSKHPVRLTIQFAPWLKSQELTFYLWM